MKEIRFAQEMYKPPIPWEAIDPEWKSKLIESNIWWVQHNPIGKTIEEQQQMDKMIRLRNKLLSFGGEIVYLPLFDPAFEKIMEKGQYWYGDHIQFTNRYYDRFHGNIALIWEQNKQKYKIATGYALSKNGYWKQHSWIVEPLKRKCRIVETSETYIAYFGFILTEEESRKAFQMRL